MGWGSRVSGSTRVMSGLADDVAKMGEAVGARNGNLGMTNSGLDAIVGNQGTVEDWVWLGYWRQGLPGLG